MRRLLLANFWMFRCPEKLPLHTTFLRCLDEPNNSHTELICPVTKYDSGKCGSLQKIFSKEEYFIRQSSKIVEILTKTTLRQRQRPIGTWLLLIVEDYLTLFCEVVTHSFNCSWLGKKYPIALVS